MELATALIWTLRIVLPIILFWIYFKLQAPKDDPWSDSHSKGPRYARSKILAHRQTQVGCPAPESLSNITLVDETKAPALFMPGPRGRGRGGGGERRGADGEKAERGGKDKEQRRERREQRQASAADAPVASVPEIQAVVAPENIDSGASEEQQKMHLESLLNYVAFNRKEQQRTFLPEEAGIRPPPPPKKPSAPVAKAPGALGDPVEDTPSLIPGEATIEDFQGATSEKANAEAQMVLRGALGLKRADVAWGLHEKLVDSNIEVAESSYTLMIEVCLLARDLKSASDFLMKMEAAGYCPDTELLDKVMDLYSSQKEHEQQQQRTREEEAVRPSAAGDLLNDIFASGAGAVEDLSNLSEADRAKLSSDAPIFVPSFKSEAHRLSSDAPIFAPMALGGSTTGAPPPPPPRDSEGAPRDPQRGSEPTQHTQHTHTQTTSLASLTAQRTALKATSKPFISQGGVTFDPYGYTWTVENPEPDDSKGKDSQGKGKGRKEHGKGNKGEGKSKGEWNGSDDWEHKKKQFYTAADNAEHNLAKANAEGKGNSTENKAKAKPEGKTTKTPAVKDDAGGKEKKVSKAPQWKAKEPASDDVH